MDIKEVKEVLLKWMRSCDKVEQVEGLEKFVTETFPLLFEAGEEAKVSVAKGELLDAMMFKKSWINDAYENSCY